LRINCYLHSINWFSIKEIPQVTTDPTADRAALIAGLRSLADFLDEHPAVPVPPAYSSLARIVVLPPHESDDQDRAFVDDFAAALGVAASDPSGSGHYAATRKFGPVEFESFAISTAARDARHARDSYADVIRLDDGQVAA
jgi:hypothetical protein